MKNKFRRSLKRSIAFVSAFVIVASATILNTFAEKTTEVKYSVDDYTSLFPGLTDSKLKLSDPEFTEKDWYEYIEYDYYAEVEDGDTVFRIYQPTDYSAASIMAITDYNPKEVLDNSQNFSMNIGDDLQGIFEIAAQGGNISKEFAGLNIATGIAQTMNSISDVMDNSKYYSSSEFLGIPGDSKYRGISNNGFYNQNTLEIEIVETETISACKTVAVNSNYSLSETYSSSKDYSNYREIGSSKSQSKEDSVTNGLAISNGISETKEISESVANAISHEIIAETARSAEHATTTSEGISAGLSIGAEQRFGAYAEAGAEADTGVIIAKAKASATVGASAEFAFTEQFNTETFHETSVEDRISVSESMSIGESTETSHEIGTSLASTQDHSISENLEKSKSESSSIENSMTNGENSSSGQEHVIDTAVDLGYGVDYQYGNEHSLSVGVTRSFNRREDTEVENVGWKLCEYIVKVPYYIEAVKVDSTTGEERILYGQYVNYNLLNGVSRVFANGYIEHWYTGELVTYADFFEGFITATELVDIAKSQQESKIPKEGN